MVKIDDAIDQKGLKKIFIAKQLNMRPETLSRKLKHPETFTASEMAVLSKLLNVDVTQLDFGVFFYGKT